MIGRVTNLAKQILNARTHTVHPIATYTDIVLNILAGSAR